jgi:single-stranded-DNA-specific exonuclease
VEHSLAGRRWLLRPADERVALALAQRLGLPEVVARVLAGRGVDLDDAEAFLNPTLRQFLPDPSHLKDMDRAAERLARAVMDGEEIAVFGDYDVDGATATALLSRFFAAVGAGCRVYVPDRLKEGYGPNTEALRRLKADGAAVVVTVDCGTSAHEPLAAAAAIGLDVIVVDHHAPADTLPPAVAIINPNRADETSPHRHLAAVGVAFLVAVAVNRALRTAGWYDSRPEPDLRQWLDLVALGTICDVVPLIGINRALVRQGLKVMAKGANAGLRALVDSAGLREAPGAYHAGFVLGPRINAGGRVGEAGIGARLLATDDAEEAARLATKLGAFNRERQLIEAAVLGEALAQAEGTASQPLIFASGDGWHPGVVGIVASRLTDRFHKPAFVVSFDGGRGTGSARSVAGFHLGAAINAAVDRGLLIRGGGHAMAAGFSLERALFADLRCFLTDRFHQVVDGAPALPTLLVDGALSVAGAQALPIAALAQVGPHGAGNPEPRFVIAGARIARLAVVGDDHVRLLLTDDGGSRLDAIAFRSRATPLGAALQAHDGAVFHIAGRLKARGEGCRGPAQLLIDDAAPVTPA